MTATATSTNRRCRSFVGGIFLLALYHSLAVYNPRAWRLGEMKRDLQALVVLQPKKKVDESQNLALSQLTMTSPVHCRNASYCCGLWNVSADHWWVHHPDWEVVQEDSSKFCFAPMQNATKRAFLKDLHWLQWNLDIDADYSSGMSSDVQSLQRPLPSNYSFTVNCSDMRATVSINSGYGASTMWLVHSFWEAYTQRKPFQTIQKWPWLYTFNNNPSSNSSWANCGDDKDQACFYLPLSPCSREDKNQQRYEKRPDNGNQTQNMQKLWMEEYISRPKQFLRKHLYHLRQKVESKLKNTGCLALHVRRGDAGAPRPPYRRYAAVPEYLKLVPDLNEYSTIFLLTDDASTVEEVQQHHLSKHRWVYIDKIRVHGVEQGFNNHIPAQSTGPDELAFITLEQELAATYCDSFVHGRSGYAYMLEEKMEATGRPIKMYYLETRVPPRTAQPFKGKPRDREAYLMQQVNSVYNKSQGNVMVR